MIFLQPPTKFFSRFSHKYNFHSLIFKFLEINRERSREKSINRDREIDQQTERQTEKQTNRQKGKKTERQ